MTLAANPNFIVCDVTCHELSAGWHEDPCHLLRDVFRDCVADTGLSNTLVNGIGGLSRHCAKNQRNLNTLANCGPVSGTGVSFIAERQLMVAWRFNAGLRVPFEFESHRDD